MTKKEKEKEKKILLRSKKCSQTSVKRGGSGDKGREGVTWGLQGDLVKRCGDCPSGTFMPPRPAGQQAPRQTPILLANFKLISFL